MRPVPSAPIGFRARSVYRTGTLLNLMAESALAGVEPDDPARAPTGRLATLEDCACLQTHRNSYLIHVRR